MDIEAQMAKTARHEALHACYAVHKGLEVERISILPDAEAFGTTTVIWPLALKDLWWQYRQHPLPTLAHVRTIIAVITAPHLCMEAEAPLHGTDRQVLGQWQERWRFAAPFTDPPGPPWTTLRTQAAKEVEIWYAIPGAREQTNAVTDALLQQGTLTGAEFLTLVRQHRLNPLLYLRGHNALILKARFALA
jgi:hypothetical protein